MPDFNLGNVADKFKESANIDDIEKGDLEKTFAKFIVNQGKVTRDKDFLTTLFENINNLGVKKPDMTPEITPVNPIVNAGVPPVIPVNNLGGSGVNKGGVDTGVGKVIQTNVPMTAGYAPDTMLDRAELAASVAARNRLYSGRQAGDTQDITTNTLGTGKVEQNVKDVFGRTSYEKLGQEQLAKLEKEQTKAEGIQLEDIPMYTKDQKGITELVGYYKGRRGSRPMIMNKQASFADQLKELTTMFGGEIPKDTTLFSGGVGIKVNQSLTGEQSQMKSSTQTAIDVLGGMEKLIDADPSGFKKDLIASKAPYWLLGIVDVVADGLGIDANTKSAQAVKALFDVAQTEITTARGGKQLTPTEIEFLLKWLPHVGQDINVMKANIGIIKSSMQRILETLKTNPNTDWTKLFTKQTPYKTSAELGGNDKPKKQTKTELTKEQEDALIKRLQGK